MVTNGFLGPEITFMGNFQARNVDFLPFLSYFTSPAQINTFLKAPRTACSPHHPLYSYPHT
jgi:hypothetical protein